MSLTDPLHGVEQEYAQEGPTKGARGLPVLGRGREMDRLVAEMLEQLRLMQHTQTELVAQLRGGIMNGVLDVAQLVFPTEGVISRSYQTQVGTIWLVNNTGASVTVQAGSSGGTTAPTSGRGVQIVPASSMLAVPIGARAFTLYGSAGTSVAVQAYTGLHALGTR